MLESGLPVAAVLLSLQLRSGKREYELFIVLGACLCIFGFVLTKLDVVIQAVNQMQSYVHLDVEYVSILIKMIGITYVSEFSSNLCRDAGYQAVAVKAGQVLKFTAPKTGCRAFIAFAGGLDIPLTMGSRSTYMKAKIGGYQGRKLEKGDQIGFRAPVETLKRMEDRVLRPEFAPKPVYTLRVVMGPQDDYFTDAGIDTFLGQTYTVTPEFDRMGCRLDGPAIAHKDGGDIISDGIAFGAIQVPSAGTPIIMLADRQTTGGYTKIANVITADFRILAQLKTGDKVQFVETPVEYAQSLLLAQRSALKALSKINN